MKVRRIVYLAVLVVWVLWAGPKAYETVGTDGEFLFGFFVVATVFFAVVLIAVDFGLSSAVAAGRHIREVRQENEISPAERVDRIFQENEESPHDHETKPA